MDQNETLFEFMKRITREHAKSLEEYKPTDEERDWDARHAELEEQE